MTYKETLTAAMTKLAEDPLFRVVGYDVCKSGGAGGGTFAGVPESMRLEMPLQEQTMAGVAIGMSLMGLRPLLWIERFDFIFRALDPLVLHLDKLGAMSHGIHRPACIIRVAIGNRSTPMFAGPTHTADLTKSMCELLSFRVVKLMWKESILNEYERALSDLKDHKSTMLIEDLDLMNT
jgi:pyruvate/2-oxoglutarate/acetoin dehydrogenase E1 component